MRERVQGVLAVVVALVAVAGVVAGCAAAGATPRPAGSDATQPPTVTTTAVPGRADVDPGGEISVTAPDAALRDVALTGADGRPIAGAVTPDGHRWAATEALGYGKPYTWSGVAVGADGATTPVAGGFTTVSPERVVRAQFAQPDDATVGVAAPIAIQFDGPVTDKAAAERALQVRTSVPTEGSWAWLPDDALGSRVHWRPKEYWKPGTVVDVAANLYGVNLGDGAYGREDLTNHLTVGRSQIVRADVTSHRMVVIRDGQQVMDVPASYGLGSDPNRITRSGTHVVTEKFDNKRMTSAAVRLRPRRALGRAHEQQRRVHPRQPGVGGRPGLEQRHPRLRQPLAPPTHGRTTTPRSTATPSRSRTPRSSSPPPTGTSTTGPSTGTPGAGCRR